MATILQQNQDDDEETNQGPQPVVSGQNAGPITGGGAPAQQNPQGQQANPKGTSSGRFTNIQKYLKANTGTDYASQIGGKTDAQAQSVREGIDAAKNAAIQSAQPEMQRLQGAGDLTQQAINDPAAFAANQANVDAFNKVRQGQFQSNVALENEGNLANQAKSIADRAAMAGTESGRFQLLRDQFGNAPGKTYTKGSQRLDQLLLQGQGGQLGQLAQRSKAAAEGAQASLQGAQQAVTDTSSQLQQLGTQAQQQAEQALTGKIGSEQERLQNLAAQTQAQREAEFEQLRSGLEKGELTEEQARQLGFNPDDENSLRLYGNNPLDFLNRNAIGQAGIGNVAKAEDQARMEALAKLSGRQDLEDYADVGEQLKGVNTAFNQDAIRQQQAAGQARIGDITSQYQQQRAPQDQQLHDYLRAISGNWNLGTGNTVEEKRSNISGMSNEDLARKIWESGTRQQGTWNEQTKAADIAASAAQIAAKRAPREQLLAQEAAAKDAAGYNQMLKIIRANQQAGV